MTRNSECRECNEPENALRRVFKECKHFEKIRKNFDIKANMRRVYRIKTVNQ